MLALKFNNEETELIYCDKHNEWYACENEMNCCDAEKEEQLMIITEK